jgi:hypothetical protein
MDRAQEKQFIDEHTSSWRLVKSTWLALTVIVVGVIVYASSPLAPIRRCKATGMRLHLASNIVMTTPTISSIRRIRRLH